VHTQTTTAKSSEEAWLAGNNTHKPQQPNPTPPPTPPLHTRLEAHINARKRPSHPQLSPPASAPHGSLWSGVSNLEKFGESPAVGREEEAKAPKKGSLVGGEVLAGRDGECLRCGGWGR
jgi:hypothetical protein